ncbi:hypothetical protein tb265_25860 [Gemmatimonadetes bacterium T265]|nr:hypothetical protein tb265_25860 [Gemmatimonadetes bacterium T265]
MTLAARRSAASTSGALRDHWPGEERLLGVALIAHVAVALGLRHFPYQDVPNHLARYTLIARAWAGTAPAWIDVHLQPTSYVALDLLGAALVATVGALATERVFALIAAVALPVGMYLLLRAVAPAQRGWAIVGVLLSFSAFFLSGFLNYVTGIGCAFVWLAVWWPRRRTTAWSTRGGLALGLVALFILHLSAPLVALFVVGLDLVWTSGRSWSPAGTARESGVAPRATGLAAARPQLATLGVCVAVLGAVWGTVAIVGSASIPPILDPVPVVPDPAILFRTPTSKLLALATPFYSLSIPELLLMTAAYGTALVLYLARQGRETFTHPLTVAALGFLALYVAWPMTIGAVRAVDARWLLPAYLLLFCGAARPERAPSAGVLVAVTTLVVLHAGLVWQIGRRIDRDLDAFDRVLARVPPGARVLPLVTAVARYGPRVSPYRHYAMWHLVRTGGRVAGLFAANGLFDDGYPYTHMAHVRERARVYYPNEDWGVRVFTALPWPRIRRDFDYIVQAGDDDARVRAAIAPYARPVFRDGDVTAYAVGSGGAAALPAR